MADELCAWLLSAESCAEWGGLYSPEGLGFLKASLEARWAAYRARYLEELRVGKRKIDKRFLDAASSLGEIDWEAINAKQKSEGDDSDDDDARVGFGPIGGGGGGGAHK